MRCFLKHLCNIFPRDFYDLYAFIKVILFDLFLVLLEGLESSQLSLAGPQILLHNDFASKGATLVFISGSFSIVIRGVFLVFSGSTELPGDLRKLFLLGKLGA